MSVELLSFVATHSPALGGARTEFCSHSFPRFRLCWEDSMIPLQGRLNDSPAPEVVHFNSISCLVVRQQTVLIKFKKIDDNPVSKESA